VALSALEDITETTVTEEVEFGSYPSPQVYTENSVISLKDNVSLNKFFSPVTLNEKLFTAGTCIIFTPVVPETSYRYFSYYRIVDGKLTKTPRLFNLRFLQQLENGVVDLTEDI
jgi:hypothetical protein